MKQINIPIDVAIDFSTEKITGANVSVDQNGKVILRLTLQTIEKTEQNKKVESEDVKQQEVPKKATNIAEQDLATPCDSEEKFKLVKLSCLSLSDPFMQYEPKSEKEKAFKTELAQAIQKGLKDIWVPICAPSAGKKDKAIRYKLGRQILIAKSYLWWEETAKSFCPERRSRLGKKHEYVAFLGYLIKLLVEEKGVTCKEAWAIVCQDSKRVGYYWNSPDSTRSIKVAGTINCCGFYDWANVCKILASDEKDKNYIRAGASAFDYSNHVPLFSFKVCTPKKMEDRVSVGWIVLEE